MTLKLPLPTIALVLVLTALAPSANADSFSVKLGAKTLGNLSYSHSGKNEHLTTKLSGTPLGVFNGTFDASSTATGSVRLFDGLSKSSRKSRHVQVTIKAGKATETLVDPVAEMTPLSDPTRVPAGIVNPVQAIGQMLRAGTCPNTITIYDGRRVIALIPDKATLDGATQTCAVAYKVIAGPGHLSPLKIAKAKMKLTYVTSDGSSKLTQISLGSGLFNVVLDRTD